MTPEEALIQRHQHRDAYEWAAEHVRAYTYRPGWEFTVRHHQVMPGDPGAVVLVVDVTVPNVDWRPTKLLSAARARQAIGNERDITVWALERTAYPIDRACWDAIRDIEDHERCEHLRREGIPVIDPHPATGPRTRP